MSDLSRVEQLLRNALGEDIYEVTPQSRVEELLQELNELIEGMGGSVSPEDIATAVAAYLDGTISTNLIGNDYTQYYPVNIPAGTFFLNIATSDGSNITCACQ